MTARANRILLPEWRYPVSITAIALLVTQPRSSCNRSFEVGPECRSGLTSLFCRRIAIAWMRRSTLPTRGPPT